ncbi:Methylthioribulose-1-phosphate dehydratase [Enhygromyxa salina]|uniref:Methylthioribulose 1-phosphate dehydratase n=1 Tax=Enhygromyxa salina TaxID=215803 RepID=A0A2S9YI41_9BACT|nr:methylthioribulose 1-phosphate dehydratase [Enhygromyxa salina]PRQ04686.1 Methylthioribulose-1-phosphate dehydratase [Enhygromyxa salina]
MSQLVAKTPPLSQRDRSTPKLISELCRQFYGLGWVSGTGGGISIRDAEGVWVAPSGVQKERIDPDEVFLLADGVWDRVEILERPRDPALRISECQPLFFNAFRMRDAGAVLHSHSLWAVLAARLACPDGGPGEFRSQNLEMQKGLRGVGCFDELRVPIIPNTARESQLSDSMADAIARYPDVDAVIVAGHGIYVWGRDWVHAKTQAECLDFLMRATVEAHRLGLGPA